jgi:hypothetical protein
MTHITPRTIARGRGTHRELADFRTRDVVFIRFDADRFVVFFERTDILLSEIRRSFRSAQSKYRTDCGTDILLREILGGV